jgi:HlyD family secretion protein
MRSPTRWAALVLATALATAACTATPTPPPTVRVDRGIVKTSVSASGTLVSVSAQNVGFPAGGKLAAVSVKVGDRVQAGQVLARQDDFALSIILEQRKAALAQQRAALSKVTRGNTVEASGASLDQAKEILAATQEQVDATRESDESATASARRQLDAANDSLDTVKKQLREDKAACKKSTATPTPTPVASGSVGASSAPATGASSSTTSSAACDRLTSDQTQVDQAETSVVTAQASVDAAEQKENTDAAAGRLSIANATQSVVTAQNNADSAGLDKPADTASAAAQVQSAQAQLDGAQRDVDDATLKAPVAGVVSAINGAVGEFVTAAAGTTAQSPGSGAPLPAVAPASGTTGATAGAAFIVLNDVASFQLVVPFEESDAAKIKPNQPVDVTVDAVAGLVAQGTVLAVAPTGAQSSGIVNYNATILLTSADPALRDGQTAEAAVTVESEDDVLRVPSSAVRTDGGRSVVSIPGADGAAVTAPFTPGKVGDQFTQVQSGLNLGQEVLLPQAQVTASPATPQQPPR